MRHRLILSVMTPARDTVVAHADTPYKEIARMLTSRRINAVPVVDEQSRVIGVVSEADLLYKESRMESRRPSVLAGRTQARAQIKADAAVAGTLMTSPAVTIGPGDDVVRAARLMEEHRLKWLPVVDEGGALLGVVSRRDLLSLFTRPDSEIEADIRKDVLRDMLWIDPREVEVSVADGIVRLSGTVDTRSTAAMVGRVVRHTDGVVGVVNGLGYARDDSTDKPSPGRLHGVFERR